MSTQAQRAEWRALADAATAGPWAYEDWPVKPWSRWQVYVNALDGIGETVTVDTTEADAAFIAAAREAVPALLDEMERLTESYSTQAAILRHDELLARVEKAERLRDGLTALADESEALLDANDEGRLATVHRWHVRGIRALLDGAQ